MDLAFEHHAAVRERRFELAVAGGHRRRVADDHDLAAAQLLDDRRELVEHARAKHERAEPERPQGTRLGRAGELGAQAVEVAGDVGGGDGDAHVRAPSTPSNSAR